MTRPVGGAPNHDPGPKRQSARAAQEAWREVLRTSSALLRRFETAGDFGELSTREYDVLRALAELPSSSSSGGLRLGALAEATYLPQPSMSRLVERLERRGLLERATCEEDGRGTVVRLTSAGRDLQREIGRRHVRSIQAALAPLSREELATLTDLLSRVRAGGTWSPAEGTWSPAGGGGEPAGPDGGER